MISSMTALTLALPWWAIVLIVIAALLVAFVVFSLTVGRKMQAKQAEAEQQMQTSKQKADILVIDKQRKKMKESGLPESVISSAPKYAQRMKVPVVKAKIGPQVRTLIADEKVYDILPVKKTCTVMISGLYIVELRAIRGGKLPVIPEKKKGFIERLKEKAAQAR